MMDKIICNICNKQYPPKYIIKHKKYFFILKMVLNMI